MNQQQLIIRLSSPSGLSRIELPANASTNDLAAQIAKFTNISSGNQKVSFDGSRWVTFPPNTPLFSFNELRVDGVRLFVQSIQAEAPKVDTSKPASAPPSAPTVPPLSCDHGPNQRCLKCMDSTKKEEKKPADVTKKEPEKPKFDAKRCDHGPGQKCLNCLNSEAKVQSDYLEKKETKCNHGPNGKCINCINNDAINIKHLSFDEYIDRNFAKCKNHAVGQKCNNCLIDLNYSYKPKECFKHDPYPKGMCSACIVPSIAVQRQPYRHVDYTQLNNSPELQNLIQFWLSSHKQRVGFLYGYYAEDPDYEKGVRAVVEAIYEPPQDNDFNSSVFREDPYAKHVEEVCRGLGFERLGWLFTTPSTDVFLSAEEMIRASLFQERFKVVHPCGVWVTKQITLVLRGNDKGVNPETYMISDQGQSLVRDQLIEAPEERKYLKVRKNEQSGFSPKFLYQNSQVEKIEPDFFLVNIASGQPKSNKFNVLTNYDFLPENRPEPQSVNIVRDYFRKYKTRGYQKYANFHLLLYLAKMFDPGTAVRIAEHVRDQKDLPDDLEKLVMNRFG